MHAIRIIIHESKLAHTRENKMLNIYPLNILNNLLFLHQVKNGKVPYVFLSKLFRSSCHYTTRFSKNKYVVPSFKVTKSKYRITIRAPKLWRLRMGQLETQLFASPYIFEVSYSTLVTWASKKSSVDQSEFEKYLVSDCKRNYTYGIILS